VHRARKLDVRHLDFFVKLLTSSTPDAELRGDEGKSKLDRSSLANHLLYERALIPLGHPLHDLIVKHSLELHSMMSTLFTSHAGLSHMAPLSSRDFFVQSHHSENNNDENFKDDYTSRSYAAESSRRLQESFTSLVPSNSSGYLSDAIQYAMDPDAIDRGEMYTFNGQRLQYVYEKAKQMRYKELEAICLQQLTIGALLDEEWSSAEGYHAKLIEIYSANGLPKSLIYNSDKERQNEFGRLLKTKLEIMMSSERDSAKQE
jgi:hypothetical protein